MCSEMGICSELVGASESTVVQGTVKWDWPYSAQIICESQAHNHEATNSNLAVTLHLHSGIQVPLSLCPVEQTKPKVTYFCTGGLQLRWLVLCAAASIVVHPAAMATR